MKEFDSIYHEYFDDVYFYLRSLSRDAGVAEELTQEVFFKALRALNKFRGDCDLRVWLCQIAKNEYFTYCRKNGRAELLDISECEASSNEMAGRVRFEEKLEDSAEALDIHKILHALDEPYKEVFSLRTFGELSFRQIAEVFGKTESWARVTYHRARPACIFSAIFREFTLQYDSMAAVNSLHLANNLTARYAHAETRQQSLTKAPPPNREYPSQEDIRVRGWLV